MEFSDQARRAFDATVLCVHLQAEDDDGTSGAVVAIIESIEAR
jgi:hypothetical protein